jgi:Bax protein
MHKPKRFLVLLALVALPITAAVTDGTAPPWPESVPDFSVYEAGGDRKAEFFEFVRPLLEIENDRVRRHRERLLAIAGRSDRNGLERWWLTGMAKTYEVDRESFSEPQLIDALLRRVDVVPMSLALAQAAKESGWGTSRFARDGNNLFGEWCFEPGCGLVPQHRADGRRHEVETFDSPRESVASYLRNLNTHERYRSFRIAREQFRATGAGLSGVVLANELAHYSERRDDYIEDIKSLIRVNKLADAVAPVSKEPDGDAAG